MDQTQMAQVVGTFKTEIYEKDGFSVFDYNAVLEDGSKKVVRMVGTNLPSMKNLTYSFYGIWGNHNGNPQFSVSYFEVQKPDSREEIIAYLKSLKCGIGSARAQLIYNKFKEKTWDVIENKPEKLVLVPGITKKVLEKLLKALEASRSTREMVKLFSRAGTQLSSIAINRIVDRLGEDSLNKIQANPFAPYPTSGYTFKDAECLREYLGLPLDMQPRMEAIFIKVLNDYERSGNVCMDSFQMLRRASTMSACSEAVCRTAFSTALHDSHAKLRLSKFYNQFGNEQFLVYLSENLSYENNIVSQIKRIRRKKSVTVTDIDALIAEYESKNITLAEEQKEAVKAVFANGISIITGGPGTGKSTVAKAILDIHKLVYGVDSEPLLLAPTGKAARRLAETTGKSASTIHSAIGWKGDDFEGCDEEQLEGNLILVDEASMMDVKITSMFLDHVKTGCKVVFIGDVDQLPSVGAGNVLNDMISSGVIATVRLKRIFRQAEGNLIIENAYRVNSGNTELLSGDNFHMIYEPTPEAIFNAACNIYKYCAEKYGVDNVVLLNPQRKKDPNRKHNVVVPELNKELQNRLNPVGKFDLYIKVGDVCFHKGDRIMETKNGVDAKNGDVGEIIEIVSEVDEESGSKERCAIVVFNRDYENPLKYYKEDLEHCELAWCTTVHKSQGSEYKTVIMIVSGIHKVMLKRNLIYTGITRAKENVIIIGDGAAMTEAIMNNNSEVRLTTLCQRLQSLANDKEGNEA